MKKIKEKYTTLVIIFAAVLIAGSLYYLGTQIGKIGSDKSPDIDLQAEIQKGIEDYTRKQKAAAPKAKAPKPTPVISGDYSDDDPFMGDKNAPVTLIEWSDYECPFCKRFYDQTLPQIKAEYIDTGKVKFVYRDFPLSFHKNALPSAVAAECAREQGGDETYFKYHDLIFDNQSNLSSDALKQFAVNLKLNTGKFNKCFDDMKYKDEVVADFVDGQSIGISGTPGFLLNGQLISGAQPFSVFKSAIDSAQ